MTSNRIRISIAALVLLGAPLFLRAQDDERPRDRYGEPVRDRSSMEAVMFEPHMFASDSGAVRVDILYRVRFDFFVFTQGVSASPQDYRAHGELLIELIDSMETSVSRKVQTILLKSPVNESSQLRRQYYQGAASFVVHPGRYTAVYRIEDSESRREFSDRKQILRIPIYESKALVQSNLFFVEPPANPASEAAFTAVNDNGAAQFSKNTGAFLTIAESGKTPTASYSIQQFLSEDKERDIVQKETTVVATLFPHRILRLDPTNSESIRYVMDSSATSSTVYFPLLTSHLRQGRYELRMHIDAGDTASLQKEFSVRWTDMPLSLYDLDFAVTAMRYITTEDEYDDLRSGGRAKRIKKFDEFWAKRDQTPETAYNEVMTEYFRRVDYAFTNFRTLKEENGVLTDRGRVYVLFGKPTTIHRSLAPGGPPRELWTYDSLKKEFIFEDPSRQGNYKLIEAETK